MPKTILVTGAAGFIGSHTVDALVARGDTVVGIDNFNDYYDPAFKRRNVKSMSAFELAEGDIRDAELVRRLFDRHRFDAVIHLAAMAGVRASIERSALYYDVNVHGTRTLMDAAVKREIGNFVLASTSSVYGPTQRIPFVEDDPCDRPLSPYAASKRAAEMMGYTYHHLYGLQVTGLRFFTVYGPRNRPDMMAFKVLASVQDGTRVPLYANGQMWRDWTFVGDIVEGVVAAADTPLGYEVLNIGRGEPILLRDFVTRLEALAGGSAVLDPTDRPGTDVVKTWADVSRLTELLGYHPTTDLEAGTQALWAWYQSEVESL